MNNTAHMMEAGRPVKSRRRTQSRGSTASIHSVTTTPNLDHSFADASAVYSTQWLSQDRSQPRELAPAPSHMAQMAGHLGPEDIILQAASHLQASRDFSMDASMAASVGHSVSFHQHAQMGHAPLQADSMSVNNSFVDGDSQMMDREGEGDGDSVAGVSGTGKAARSSANNELEMRQLFSQNKHRTLVDVAEELHGNERGPHSERTRQVFAMLWINQVCTKGKGSVPRGRVYANYASRCATERITVLNPASFGKLVRVLFPGLKTRRLGVRGESKYHYVNFALTEEQPELKDPPSIPQVPLTESASLTQNFNTIPTRASSVRAERAALPSPDHQLYQQQESDSQAPRPREYRHSLYNMPKVATIDELNSTTHKTTLKLSLSPDTGAAFKQSDPVVLPRIQPFLPSGTDPDAAKSLEALYRSHCTSLVECIRYCKEKTFFHLFTSFQGTLTMPVQKLFSNPAIAPWIEECDFVLYQRMMRILSGLTLQVVPKPVLDTIRSISERLVVHIRESFQGQPAHVVRAKEAPATIFAALLDRELRVNLTAHAAANMLSNPANRDQMYLDWITMVRTRKVAESVPTRAMDEVVNIMISDIRDLLDPATIPWEVEALTLHGEMAVRNGRQPQPSSLEEAGASTVLDRWVTFLRSLPDRFPYASHTDIVWCIHRLGTAVMRDLTIAQGKSFGSWWVTKCWIDEMASFLAEQGGFLAMKSTQSAASVVDAIKKQELNPELSLQESRYSTGSDDFGNLASHLPQVHSQPSRAPFQPSNNTPTAGHDDGSHSPNHDDSGIGIRTPDEDFPPMDKFEFPTPDTSQMLNAGADLPTVISAL